MRWPGGPGGQEGIQGIPWGYRVGLMSLLMIHKVYMPVYIVFQIFLAHGRDGRDQPKVVQEVLADLKIISYHHHPFSFDCVHYQVHQNFSCMGQPMQCQSLESPILDPFWANFPVAFSVKFKSLIKLSKGCFGQLIHRGGGC